MNPLFRIDFSISDSLKIVRKSVLIYETIIIPTTPFLQKMTISDATGQNHPKRAKSLDL